MIDEVEKAFAGMNGSGDSGVASRMFGTFLSWLHDHESDVFVVCTANDVSKLPPEFSRSERFDGVFFLDLPSREEKDAIWKLYRDLYEIDSAQRAPDDTNWTGAEIKSCCRLAALLDLPLNQAAQNVVPVAVTASESVGQLRSWASGRCLSASRSGIYQQINGTPGRSSFTNSGASIYAVDHTSNLQATANGWPSLFKDRLGQGGYDSGPGVAERSGLRPFGPGLGSKLSVN